MTSRNPRSGVRCAAGILATARPALSAAHESVLVHLVEALIPQVWQFAIIACCGHSVASIEAHDFDFHS